MQRVARVGSRVLVAPSLLSFLLSLLLGACGSEEELKQVTASFAASGTGVQISGYAATGAPVPAGSAVEVRCVNGNSSSTTSADGSFVVLANDLVFPCLLRTTWGSGASQQTLHSVAATAGVTQITPLTQVLVDQATGGTLDALFASPTSAGLQSVVMQLPALQTKLRQVLSSKGLGANLSVVPGDFFTGPIKPATAGSGGNAYDLLLDAVSATVGGVQALGTTFAQAFFVDLGISARVDWSKCSESPRRVGNGYFASGCNGRSVILSRNPYEYQQRSTYASGYIDMTVLSDWPGYSENRCVLKLSVSQIASGNAQNPAWVVGDAYFMSGWETSLMYPTGIMFFPEEGGSGGMVGAGGASNGSVLATGPDSGASVISVSTAGGRGELIFEGTYIRRVTMRSGECLWKM